MAHIMSTSRGKHAAAKHRNHFLLVRGMGGRVAEVEFMKQGSIVMQQKTDSLTCLYFNRLKRKEVIAHSYLNGAIYRLRVSWLPKVERMTMAGGGHCSSSAEDQTKCGKKGKRINFHWLELIQVIEEYPRVGRLTCRLAYPEITFV